MHNKNDNDDERYRLPSNSGNKACQYPIGDPHDKTFSFCGAEVMARHPYCAKHCEICYTSKIDASVLADYLKDKSTIELLRLNPDNLRYLGYTPDEVNVDETTLNTASTKKSARWVTKKPNTRGASAKLAPPRRNFATSTSDDLPVNDRLFTRLPRDKKLYGAITDDLPERFGDVREKESATGDTALIPDTAILPEQITMMPSAVVKVGKITNGKPPPPKKKGVLGRIKSLFRK